MATAPPGLDNVMCPSNATSALNCSFNIPPVSPQCYSNFSAAGVRCVQGVLFILCPVQLFHCVDITRTDVLLNKWRIQCGQYYI